VLHGRLAAAASGLTGAEGEARSQITLAFVVMAAALSEQIAVLDAEIGRLFAAHPDRRIFASLPRWGMIRAATLLTEIGDCRERFPTDDALAALAGACPSTRQSGKRSQAVFRWSCSKKLRAAVMDFANGSCMGDPWAAAIYAAAVRHAIRILARAWLRVIWRCWLDGAAFDPAACTAAARPPPLDIGHSYVCQPLLKVGRGGGRGSA
jgi:transposase